MKWVNHEIITGVIVYAATENPLAAVYSMAGAILPDKIEGNPGSGSYWSWRSRHRGWSHWPMLYILLLGLQLRMIKGGWDSFTDMGMIGVFFCVGALLHIIEDAMCYNPEGLSFEDFEQEYKENNILRGCLYYEKIPLM